ncbi:MAG: metal-dependent hydrolase [Acidobacteriota bacterium]
MDPITHALAGGLVARTGLSHRLLPPELERRGVIWTAAFSLAPDLDAVSGFSNDPLAFLRYHRGFTHSILGGGVLAVILALIFARLFPGVRRWRLLALTATGVYLHILLDLMNSYGTVLLYPFRATRYTLDWLFTIDPTFTGILLGAVLAVYLLRRAPRLVAKVGIVLAGSYILLCGALQWHARQAIAAEAVAQDIGGIRRISALPEPFVPLKWTGIVETSDTYYQAHLELGNGTSATIRFAEVPKITPGASRQALSAVTRQPLREQAQLYDWFARFPVITVEREPGGQLVRFYDLRFDLPGLGPNRRPYLFTVRLDAAGKVVETKLK